MAFDLSKYMTAEERIELFAKDNPDMRQKSEREIVDGMVYVTVILWRTWADPHPWVYGMAAESLKTQFAVEKTETSAYARAITNTGLPQYSTTFSISALFALGAFSPSLVVLNWGLPVLVMALA